ncbi:MAG: lactonase family protein [Bacteroidales bacterium]|nr:lactonase family protein [Bacteroidales bacterium]
MKKILNLLLMVFLIPVFSCVNSQTARLYVGTYTGRDNPNGFHIIDVDFGKGEFTPVSSADAGPNPSYLCISKTRSMAYAANESNRDVDGIRMGSVTALKLDVEAGTAEKVKALDIPVGGPCFVSITPEEDFLLLAHYGAGAISVVRLDASGLPAEVTDTIVFRQEGIRSARGHMTSVGPDGKKIYLTCLALDKVMIFYLDKATGKLTQTGTGNIPEGDGPRHFTFSKDGTKMFVINELGSTVTVFNIAADGNLTEIQTISTLPAEGFAERNSCADIHLSKDGNYLYGSNRGHNSIVTYRVGADGRLTLAGITPCGGDHPRNFTLDPSGKYLLVGNMGRTVEGSQTPANLSLFEIDQKTGLPVPFGTPYDLRQSACLKFIE